MLPRVEPAEELRHVDWVMGQVEAQGQLAAVPLLAIVEMARGLVAVDSFAAASPRLRRLDFGAVDLANDMMLDLHDDAGAMAQARFAVSRASRAASLEPPLDTGYIDVNDAAGLRSSALGARALGFTGKACIHPKQIDTVNEVFTPTAEELARAARIVAGFERAEAEGAAAVLVDGQMVDCPVFEHARRVLLRGRAATTPRS